MGNVLVELQEIQSPLQMMEAMVCRKFLLSLNNVYNGSWPGNKYLNIFVVNDARGAAGYIINPEKYFNVLL